MNLPLIFICGIVATWLVLIMFFPRFMGNAVGSVWRRFRLGWRDATGR